MLHTISPTPSLRFHHCHRGICSFRILECLHVGKARSKKCELDFACLELMDALWCTVAPLSGDQAAAEEACICTSVAHVFHSTSSFVSHGFDVSVSGLGHVLWVSLCAFYAQVKLSRLLSKNGIAILGLHFSNHEPARHKRHHESWLHTDRLEGSADSFCIYTTCVLSIPIHHEAGMISSPWFVSAATVAWPWPKWIGKLEKVQRSCYWEVAKKRKTCDHLRRIFGQNYNDLNWLCSKTWN